MLSTVFELSSCFLKLFLNLAFAFLGFGPLKYSAVYSTESFIACNVMCMLRKSWALGGFLIFAIYQFNILYILKSFVFILA